MKHYGDITKLNGNDLPAVDIITGGSPCQDLSVAGKRAGLAGERSGLFMEQIRLIKKAGKGPLVQTELSATLGVSQDQTLIAFEQHAIAYRGDAITSPVNASNPQPGDPCHTLMNDSRNYVVLENHPADSRVKISEDGMVQTLSSRMGTGGGNVPMVMEDKEYIVLENHPQDSRMKIKEDGIFQTMGARQGAEGDPHTLMVMELSGAQRIPDKDNFNAVITTSHGGFMVNADESGVAHTLEASDHKDSQIVAYGLDRAAYNQGQNAKFGFSVDEEKVGAQTAKGPGAVCSAVDCRNGVEDADKNGSLQSRSSNNINSNNVCRVGSVVRRLTPLECERLQGYPDRWTDIGEWVDSKGKKHKDADSPRYKALGNSIALPFWQWMAARMVRHIDHEPTMASLFDGIGGFPLVFSRCGCKPIWASEIEEFPIAVTKKRFGG